MDGPQEVWICMGWRPYMACEEFGDLVYKGCISLGYIILDQVNAKEEIEDHVYLTSPTARMLR